MSDSNGKTPGREALSPAIELMRKATEQAVNEAMEDQFLSFLEDCVSGSGPPRNGHYERKVLTTVGEINVRVPRDRLGLFVAKWSQTYPSFRKYLTEPGLLSFYRFPQGSLEAPLHLKRGRGLPRLPQKEAEGQAGPPFPQERVLPHSRRGGEMQQIRQEQEADRLR